MNAALPPGWSVVPLESLLVTSRDLTYGVVQPGAHQSDGVPIARVGDIRGGHVDLADPLRIAASVESSYARSRIEGGELLVTLVGTVGECAVAPEAMRGWNVARAVAVARIRPDVGARWVARCLEERDAVARIVSRVNTTVQTTLNLKDLRQVPIVLPAKSERAAIAAVADTLDDKIESNRQTCHLLRELGHALVVQAGRSRTMHLRDLTISISRGVTPQYADEDAAAPVVVNQKCVRDGWVSLGPARRMMKREVPEQKRVAGGDVLVNSTGMGTLGRVGRWHSGEVFADSHVSIIKADPVRIGPTLLAYLMFSREVDIEAMATGSTGQTELSPTRLGELKLDAPSEAAGTSVEPVLFSLESRAAAVEAEIASLARMRDTLLPELLSGRIRVPEAQEAVTDAVVS